MLKDSEILLARLDERTNSLSEKLDTIVEMLEENKKKHTEHNLKFDELHRWKHETIGFNRGSWKTSTVFGAIAGAVGAWIISLFRS